MKKTLCFVIVYIGELKYYERLFPRLENDFDIHLVFIRPDDDRRRQAVTYAKENGYRYSIIEYDLGGKSKKGHYIPFVTALIKYYKHTRVCHEFLINNKIARLVGPKASLPMRPLFREANYLGIKTMAIQRGHVPPSNRYGDTQSKLPLWTQVYAWLIERMRDVMNFFFFGPKYAFASQQPQVVGAIGEEGKTVLPERYGYDPKSITVLGSVEHQQLTELMKKLKSDSAYKKSLTKKYGIDVGKKMIFIVSARYRHYINSSPEYTKEEERDVVAYFDDVIRIIREVYPENVADIHFKLHPAEDNIYESYKKYGTIIHGNEAKIDELVAICDLYISYPVTSANYMAVASGIPAIFINFSPLQVLNRSAGDFDITHVVTDKDEFKRLLSESKKGTMKAQYDSSNIKRDAIDNTVKFIKNA